MRYSRQEILLGKRQQMLGRSTVAIVGLGALGSVSAELLVRAGVGLILIDRDIVELSNLQRQGLFTEEDIGKPKALCANEHLKKINSTIKIKAYAVDLSYENINLVKSDLILDCTDNLETRFLINEYCIKNNIPWIYAAAIANKGYVFNVMPGKTCFRCIFKHAYGLETCDTAGILNTTSTTVAALQVNEAIKILTKQEYEKDLLHIDLKNNKITKIKVKKNSKCPACKKRFEYLTGKRSTETIKFCGTNTYQIKANLDLKKIKKRLKNAKDFGYCLSTDKITIFKDRVLIKAENPKQAKSIYSRFIGN